VVLAFMAIVKYVEKCGESGGVFRDKSLSTTVSLKATVKYEASRGRKYRYK
jgi:hypothetical protein